MQWFWILTGLVVLGFVTLVGLIVVWKMISGEINLNLLVSEKNGAASLSRFQMLVFTFVIAGGYLMLVIYTMVASDASELQSQLNAIAAVKSTDPELYAQLVEAMKTRLTEGPSLPQIPAGVLVLIGISGGSYVLSKGIQSQQEQRAANQTKTWT